MFKPRRDKFSKNDKGSGKFGRFQRGGGKGDGEYSGGWNRDDRSGWDAVCDQCGQPCTVPFKPTGSRPVLCNRCFKKDGDAAPRRFGRPDRERPSFRRDDRGPSRGSDQQVELDGLAKQLKSINKKLDLILESIAPAPPKKKKKADQKKEEEADHEEIDESDPIDEEDDEDDFIDDQDADGDFSEDDEEGEEIT